MSNYVRTLSIIPEYFAICQLKPHENIPSWTNQQPTDFVSITKTVDELSIICPQKNVPSETKSSLNWRCLKLEGISDVDEPGVLASLVSPLAQAGVSVFAQATYNTDYLLVNDIETTIKILETLNNTVVKKDK